MAVSLTMACAAPPLGHTSHTLPRASTSTYLIIHWTNPGHSYPRGKYIINFHPGQLPDDSSWLLMWATAAVGKQRRWERSAGQARGQDCSHPNLEQLELARNSLSSLPKAAVLCHSIFHGGQGLKMLCNWKHCKEHGTGAVSLNKSSGRSWHDSLEAVTQTLPDHPSTCAYSYHLNMQR